MSIDFEIDCSKGIVWVRASGPIDISDVFERAVDALDHPDFVPGMPTVWDMREADLSAYGQADMRLAGVRNRDLAERRGTARMAVVVSDDFSFGVARMHQVLGESPNLEVSVFRDLSAAERWALRGSGSGEEDSGERSMPPSLG